MNNAKAKTKDAPSASLLSSRGLLVTRMLVVMVAYSLALAASLWLAYVIRFDFIVPLPQHKNLVHFELWIVPLQLTLLLLIGQFAGLLSYFGIPDLRRLSLALCGSAIILAVLWSSSDGLLAPPRSVILTDLLLSFLIISGIRLFFRLLRERHFKFWTKFNGRVRRVGIVGAGYVGASLARELLVKTGLGLRPVAFFDDDRQKWHTRLHDISVIGPPESLLDVSKNLKLDKVIIAMPSAPAKRIGEIVKVLRRTGLKFETVPSLDQLATGEVKVSQLRAVEIQDLLGREPVKLATENIRHILKGKLVMVTGAGGSIGSELCRQILTFNPKRLLLVDRSEVQMFQIEQELVSLGHQDVILPLVADILDLPRMRFIFEHYQPEVVFHAAAHKHVPMMESHPCEAIKNNALGTAQVAELALAYGADRFVLVSTDKAINPTNVMGATKRLAEIYLQALHASQPAGTKFMAVRFGNVLGSSGSVIPTFAKQIAAGGPVKVTHPDVTRYFMTIPEAVGLVLQSGAQGEGGEIFVLDMGQPVKILDLARHMIELSGLKPGQDIEIEFVGLRPGEKLFEELSYESEDFTHTDHPKIMRFNSQPAPLELMQDHLRDLNTDLHDAEPEQLKLALQRIVPEYKPFLESKHQAPLKAVAKRRLQPAVLR